MVFDISQINSYRKQQEFDDWMSNARGCGIKEFEKCKITFMSWSEEILIAFKYSITGGVIE
jgi:transposase